MTFTVHETDKSCKTNGWTLGTVEAETIEEAVEKANQEFKPNHKGKIWVQYPNSYLKRHSRVKF